MHKGRPSKEGGGGSDTCGRPDATYDISKNFSLICQNIISYHVRVNRFNARYISPLMDLERNRSVENRAKYPSKHSETKLDCGLWDILKICQMITKLEILKKSGPLPKSKSLEDF